MTVYLIDRGPVFLKNIGFEREFSYGIEKLVLFDSRIRKAWQSAFWESVDEYTRVWRGTDEQREKYRNSKCRWGDGEDLLNGGPGALVVWTGEELKKIIDREVPAGKTAPGDRGQVVEDFSDGGDGISFIPPSFRTYPEEALPLFIARAVALGVIVIGEGKNPQIQSVRSILSPYVKARKGSRVIAKAIEEKEEKKQRIERERRDLDLHRILNVEENNRLAELAKVIGPTRAYEPWVDDMLMPNDRVGGEHDSDLREMRLRALRRSNHPPSLVDED